MAAMKILSAPTWKSLLLAKNKSKREVLEANRLEQRSGPTFVYPDLGFSLFVTVQNTLNNFINAHN